MGAERALGILQPPLPLGQQWGPCEDCIPATEGPREVQEGRGWVQQTRKEAGEAVQAWRWQAAAPPGTPAAGLWPIPPTPSSAPARHGLPASPVSQRRGPSLREDRARSPAAGDSRLRPKHP